MVVDLNLKTVVKMVNGLLFGQKILVHEKLELGRQGVLFMVMVGDRGGGPSSQLCGIDWA